MTPDEILAAFQRNVRRLDNWRGYIGDDEDSPSDDEVHEVLQRARLALAEPREGVRIAEALYLRVAELEQQRDAVLALCDEAERSALAYARTEGLVISADVAPDDIRAIYHPAASKPVLLDVSRDPQRHPRGEDGQFIERGERG